MSGNAKCLDSYNKRLQENWSRCSRCNFEGSIDNFPEHQLKLKYSYCKRCRKVVRIGSYMMERQKTLLKDFGVSQEKYYILFNSQKGKCAICKKEEAYVNHTSKRPHMLAVDHCHSSGKVRGLLCRNCNVMLGNARDSQKILRSAIRYLDKAEK